MANLREEYDFSIIADAPSRTISKESIDRVVRIAEENKADLERRGIVYEVGATA